MTGRPDAVDEQQILQFLTTEHFALQTARSATVADSAGRSSLSLSTVASALIARAFIGQVSQLGRVFFTFALVPLPSLCFLGVVTCARVLDREVEGTAYARGMNRIRHYDLDLAPSVRPYFILSAHDALSAVRRDLGASSRWPLLLLSTSGMVAMITSVLAGTSVGLLAGAVLTAPLAVPVGAGALTFAASLGLLTRYQARRWMAAAERLRPMFPSLTQDEEGD